MRWSSFRDAWNGLVFAVRSERSMRVHVFAAVVVIAAGVGLTLTRFEWMMCALCMGLVLSLEQLNTAVEKTLDLLHPERDPRVGRIKDMAAGAVLIAALAATAVAAFIVAPRLFG